MNKNIVGSNIRWENYETMRPGGSLIISSPTGMHQSGLSPKPSPKYKLDDLLHKQHMLARHSSEEEFKRFNLRGGYATEGRPEEDRFQQRGSNLQLDKNINWERLAHLRKGSSKDQTKDPEFFKARNSGGRANNRLKETASTTTSNEPLQTYKSEKMLPSFLRNQTKSPERLKVGERKGLSRENFKIIRRLGEGKFGMVSLAR
jgi:hypothetical protein